MLKTIASNDGYYVSSIALLVVVAVVVDLVLNVNGMSNSDSSLVIWLLSAPFLTSLLYQRAKYIGIDRRTSILGIFPPIGIIAGIVLYFVTPKNTQIGES